MHASLQALYCWTDSNRTSRDTFCPGFAAKPVNTRHALPGPAEGIGSYH